MRRKQKSVNTLQWLTLTIAALTVVAAGGGLFLKNLYHDPANIITAWFGNDLVTLLVVIPILLASWSYFTTTNYRAQMVWLAVMAYMIYNYAFYLFGAVFNKFFLLYVLIFSLSLYALIIGLSVIDKRQILQHVNAAFPRKWAAIFLLLVALPLAIVEIRQYIYFISTGQPPAAPSLIFALDLSIVVPNTILASILLWKKKAWGYILGAIMLIKSFAYGLVLVVGTILVAAIHTTGKLDPLMPFYIFVTAGGLIFGWLLLKSVTNQPTVKV